MKKKPNKKSTGAEQTKNSSQIFVRYTSVSLGILFVAFIGIAAVQNASITSVLGTSTKSTLLADQGETDHGGDAQNSAGTQKTDQQNSPTGDIHITSETSQGQTQGNKSELNSETAGTAIKTENKGTTEIAAHNADGSEGKIQNNSLEKINEALKGKNVEVGSSSADNFTIKSGEVEAETHFPLSINPTTKTLSVTTPAGTKQVTVLPNQAVNNILQQKILSKISSSSGQTATNGAAIQTVALTQIKNQPAFAIQGVSDKRLFGIFPVSLPKTVYVSAQTGQVLHTNESFFTQIIGAFSL